MHVDIYTPISIYLSIEFIYLMYIYTKTYTYLTPTILRHISNALHLFIDIIYILTYLHIYIPLYVYISIYISIYT